MTLRERMRAFVSKREGSPEQLAVAFLRTVTKADLEPLLVEEFKWLERTHVRMAEISLLRSAPRTLHTAERTRGLLADLAPLLDKPYRIGDGRARRFGELTSEEHLVRIEMLRANINGMQRDIALHERALQLIEQHAVSCLDEIGACEVAA